MASDTADYSVYLKASEKAYSGTLLGQIDHRLLQAPAAKYVIWGILTVAVLIPSVQFVDRIREIDPAPFVDSGERHRTALGRWIPTALLVEGRMVERDPYGIAHWFPLPPFVLLAIVPLAELGYVGAGLAWAILKIAGLFAGLIAFLRSMQAPQFAVPLGVLVMAALFGMRPLIADIQHGNVNLFVFVWVALCWARYARGRDIAAGVFLAMAIVTKITPALLLVYFIYKRNWRVSLSTAAGCVIVFVVVPGLWFGFAESFALHRAWFDMLVAPFAFHGWVTINEFNQSLYGVVLRMGEWSGVIQLERMPLEDALVAGNDVMARPVDYHFLRPLISVTVLGAMAWLCRAQTANRRDPRLLLEFALVLVAMLLLGERTWKHHATTLMIVFLVLWYVVACLPWNGGFRAVLAGGLFAQWFLLMATSEGVFGDDFADRAMYSGLFCWGLLLCFVEIGLILRALHRKKHIHACCAETPMCNGSITAPA